jgi:hypothetical protein
VIWARDLRRIWCFWSFYFEMAMGDRNKGIEEEEMYVYVYVLLYLFFILGDMGSA